MVGNIWDWLCSRSSVHIRLVHLTPPQQNGCAERFNRTLLEKANAMRHHACMPHIFWQDAVQTALHIYNHQPMCRLHWKTPNEMFLSDKPDISYFKIFGTCAYVHIPSDTREDKLSPRAEQMIFIDRKSVV